MKPFHSALAIVTAVAAFSSLTLSSPTTMAADDRSGIRASPRSGQLSARARAPTVDSDLPHGVHEVGAPAARQALLYLPSSLRAGEPAPLLVMLHGAGGSGADGLRMVKAIAQKHGVVVLSPSSRGRSWDVIAAGGYGADVEALDAALKWVLERYAIDPRRIAIGGFSDGASYALSLGVSNGELFTHVLAFSPGFMAPQRIAGTPRIFISHGVHDEVLPIDACSRRLTPQLRKAGYALEYVEFEGGHSVPDDIRARAFEWFTETDIPIPPARERRGCGY